MTRSTKFAMESPSAALGPVLVGLSSKPAQQRCEGAGQMAHPLTPVVRVTCASYRDWCQTDSVTAADAVTDALTTAGSMMFTVLRPRFLPNFTAPAMSAKRVSSLPRPTPSPGWKCVPRWRTMISPALTTWPPKRLTPRYWELESRPLRVEDAPFLCAMSVPALGSGACQIENDRMNEDSGLDPGDLDLGRVLTVTLTLPVARLVLELHDDDLWPLGGLDHLGGDPHLGELARVGGHSGTIHKKQGREIDAVARLALDFVDDEDVADGHLLLTAACANDRVHLELTLLRLFGGRWPLETGTWSSW